MSMADYGWHQCAIDRKLLRSLMRRNDRDGLLRLAGYLTLLIGAAVLAHLSLGSWWALPAFLLYGSLWIFATSIAHEACHGTPFRSRWLNETVLFFSGLMVQQPPSLLRWTHARHHSHTSRSANDYEIILENPMSWRELLWQWSGMPGIFHYAIVITQLTFGHVNRAIRDCIPESALRRTVWEARAYFVIYLAVPLLAFLTESWWPILMFVLPRFAGGPLHGMILTSQHVGLAKEVRDHRLNTRTLIAGPLLRFLYWNMNYHIEHHMFPTVPFHQLPKLHAALKDQLPRPTRGLLGAQREILATFLRQRREPDYAHLSAFPD